MIVPRTIDRTEPSVKDAICRGLDHLASLQDEDGAWRGDYGGPMFLLPMYIAACRVVGQEVPAPRAQGMISYLVSVQNPDGSVGLHAEDQGSMFTTALSYVSLRLLGLPRSDPSLVKMAAWIRDNGTALGAASWGKLILALLNLYPYEGLNPILPELWLLPPQTPIHPGRFWCHCRQVYLPMAYLYGVKAQIPEDDLIREIRQDLYDRPYHQIDFARHRDTIAPSDNRYPHSPLLRVANRLMTVFEALHPASLRQRALASLMDHIHYEDRVTNYIDIGPVNSVLNTIAHHFQDPGGEAFQRSFAALELYLWDGPDGIKFNGYNSTALWDTAFASQAFLASPLAGRHKATLRKAYGFIRDNQVLEDPPERERYFRHASRGGWPFSDRAHGWPITDCTAEGFRAALGLEGYGDELIPEERLKESIRLILSFQNDDGGWASYELQRGGAWLELLNPSQVFGDIMVDYSYVECTASCLQALALARRCYPAFLAQEIDLAMARGVAFIRGKQCAEGGWEGSWAVCYTYGTWFAVTGLKAAGLPGDAPEIARACRFLLGHQNPDGGWGESPESCYQRRYIPSPDSRAVNTAWALSTLVRAGQGWSSAAQVAADFLVRRQELNGDWPPEPLVGLFNKTVLINYENYRRSFPLWALGEYQGCKG